MHRSRSVYRLVGARSALAVTAFALLGLLSMHGWGSHVGLHAGAAIPAPPTMASPSVHIAIHDHSTAAEQTSHRPVTGLVGSGHGGADPTGPGSAPLELCLAVLGGFMLAVALLLWRRDLCRSRDHGRGSRGSDRPGRDRDPPDLLRLCVIRC